MTRAIRDFAEYNTDDKAAIIGTVNRNPSLIWVVFLTYDGPSPPEDVFRNFTQIPNVRNTVKRQSYHSLMLANDEYIRHGNRFSIGAETSVNPSGAHGYDIFKSFIDHWNNVTDDFIDIPGSVSSLALQPLPRSISTKAKESGGVSYDIIPAEGEIYLLGCLNRMLPGLTRDMTTCYYRLLSLGTALHQIL